MNVKLIGPHYISEEQEELLDDAGHWPSICAESFKIDIQYPYDIHSTIQV
jgi:hypothetical protein